MAIVALIGAGNGGRAASADLALRGHEVRLFEPVPLTAQRLADSFRGHATVTLSGALSGTADVDLVMNLGQALDGASIVVVSVPAYGLEPVAAQLAVHLRDGQIVVLHPGGSGGAFVVRRVWESLDFSRDVALGQTDTLAYACRIVEPRLVWVGAVKKRLRLAAIDPSTSAELAGVFRLLYPQTVASSSLLEVALANANPVIHPAIVLLNSRAVDRHQAFSFYDEGVSEAVCTLIDQLDSERLALAARLDVPAEPVVEFLRAVYGVDGDDLSSLYRLLAQSVYRGIVSPDHLESRYFTEDVTLGIDVLVDCAERLGVPCPTLAAVSRLARTIVDLEPMPPVWRALLSPEVSARACARG